jgi:four helix bundle protein
MDGNNFAPFPHHKLLAYEVALEFVRLIHATHLSDAEMRKHGRSSAGSCARNLAEGAGRRSRADKRRCYSIAHGELCEAVSAVEIDRALGGCPAAELQAVYQLGSRLNAMVVSLTR